MALYLMGIAADVFVAGTSDLYMDREKLTDETS